MDKKKKQQQMARRAAMEQSRQEGYSDNASEEDRVEVMASTYRRRTWKRYRWIAWFLVLIPILYLAVQLFIILAPRMRTQTAIGASMTDAVTAEGFVLLESTPLTGAGGILYYTVEPGQRVSAGTEVALVFDSEAAAEARRKLDELYGQIALLQEAQNTMSEAGDLEILQKQQDEGVYDYLAQIDTGDYAGITTACNEISLAANKIQVTTGKVTDFEQRIATLEEQKAAYEASAVPVGSITVEQTGYFVPSGKYDRETADAESMAETLPKQLQDALATELPYYGAEVVGHIVTDYKWQFLTCISSKDAAKFAKGDKLEIAFPEKGEDPLPVVVKTLEVDEALGIAKVEVSCEYINPDVLAMRKEKAQVIFSTQKGLRLEKNALRLVDETDEEGNVTTHKGVYVKFGNMVYFRKVKILLEDEHYMLVSAVYEKGVNEVEMYDEVVVDAGGVELYDKKIL